jgi:hypothetical protein
MSGDDMNMRRSLMLAAVICGVASGALAFDTKWHSDATRIAMEQNGFSADARLLCQFENYLTDYFSAKDFEDVYAHLPGEMPKGGATGLRDMDMTDLARLHFDALSTQAQVEHQWKTLEANTTAALIKWAAEPSVKPGYRPVVLMTVLGASLHAVQDFYSHSNWLRRVAPDGGVRLASAAAPSSGPAPIWFDVTESDRAKLAIKTGWYPDGNKPGVLYHREENKDATGRPLNAMAVDAATRASVDWVRRMIDATPQVPWATLKTWKAQPTNLNGTWLRNADATFITTTSAMAGHWDGATPVKNVFAPEAARNKFMAGEALGLTLGVYSRNITISHNNATPTPHWVGFTLYHVERDLGRGLYLHDVMKK